MINLRMFKDLSLTNYASDVKMSRESAECRNERFRRQKFVIT